MGSSLVAAGSKRSTSSSSSKLSQEGSESDSTAALVYTGFFEMGFLDSLRAVSNSFSSKNDIQFIAIRGWF